MFEFKRKGTRMTEQEKKISRVRRLIRNYPKTINVDPVMFRNPTVNEINFIDAWESPYEYVSGTKCTNLTDKDIL